MTQLVDPVVEEIRRIRDEQAAELNYDLKAIFERARRRQKLSKRETASFVLAVTSHNSQDKAAAPYRLQESSVPVYRVDKDRDVTR